MPIRIATVLNALGNPKNLTLEKIHGHGYFLFVYDTGPVYETQSVMVNSLNQLPLEAWVTEGKSLLDKHLSKGI